MVERIVVKRYAEAFVNFAKETCGMEKALQDLANLKAIIDNNPDFMKFLKSMEISRVEKSEFIDKAFEKDFSEEVRQFLKLLLRKDRIDKIIAIAEYIKVAYSREGIVEASLKSAFSLDPEIIKVIQERLEGKFQKRFKFNVGVDKNLLGGIQVIIGNTVIDGTVKRRLEELKEMLITVKV